MQTGAAVNEPCKIVPGPSSERLLDGGLMTVTRLGQRHPRTLRLQLWTLAGSRGQPQGVLSTYGLFSVRRNQRPLTLGHAS